jgi:molecular chaperone DnaK (HSP70)
MFMGKMKEIADSNLGRSVEDCVITCPVFYGEEQRRALQDAANIAGLRPLQIMSETTAAALAYGKKFYEHNILKKLPFFKPLIWDFILKVMNFK